MKIESYTKTPVQRKPYKEGVTSDHIIRDGWARGFDVTQTRKECELMGFCVSEKFILTRWDELQSEMEQFFNQIS